MLKRASPTVSRLADFAGRAHCGVAEFALAERLDLDTVLLGTAKEPAFGQSPYAFSRGETFENRVKDIRGEKPYDPLLTLLRQDHEVPEEVDIVDLRHRYSHRAKDVMNKRAADTRDLLVATARGETGAVLVDGGVLQANVAGSTANFEADGLALRIEGKLHVIEMKSFPIVDGQATDSSALASALDQGALYILLSRRILEAARVASESVSSTLLLVCPQGTALSPCIQQQDVTMRIARAKIAMELVAAPWESGGEGGKADEMVALFGIAADERETPRKRFKALASAAMALGTEFGPSCLGCGMYRYCRDEAHASSARTLIDPFLARELVGIDTLNRAAQLADGAVPNAGESMAAGALRAAALSIEAAMERPPMKAGDP